MRGANKPKREAKKPTQERVGERQWSTNFESAKERREKEWAEKTKKKFEKGYERNRCGRNHAAEITCPICEGWE